MATRLVLLVRDEIMNAGSMRMWALVPCKLVLRLDGRYGW